MSTKLDKLWQNEKAYDNYDTESAHSWVLVEEFTQSNHKDGKKPFIFFELQQKIIGLIDLFYFNAIDSYQNKATKDKNHSKAK